MNIYIDNNILINHEENKRLLPVGDEFNYYYSNIHIQELIEIGERLDQFQDKRIRTITDLTGNKFCQNNENYKVELTVEDPRKYLFVLLKNPLCIALHNHFKSLQQRWMEGKDPDTIMKYYGIDKVRIQNYTPEELVREYRGFIEHFVLNSADGILMSAFQSFFNAMDMLGFWQDKRTERSNMARSYDASHAYFASACDYFVTDDKRTRHKANVLYYYYAMKTKAISYQEFIEIIKDKY